jgi:hypothetical protein
VRSVNQMAGLVLEVSDYGVKTSNRDLQSNFVAKCSSHAPNCDGFRNSRRTTVVDCGRCRFRVALRSLFHQIPGSANLLQCLVRPSFSCVNITGFVLHGTPHPSRSNIVCWIHRNDSAVYFGAGLVYFCHRRTRLAVWYFPSWIISALLRHYAGYDKFRPSTPTPGDHTLFLDGDCHAQRDSVGKERR